MIIRHCMVGRFSLTVNYITSAGRSSYQSEDEHVFEVYHFTF